jgi:hypothetical protein
MDRISNLQRARKRLSPAQIRTLFADLVEPFVPGLNAVREGMAGNYGTAAVSGLLDVGGPIGKGVGLAAPAMAGIVSPEIAKKIRMMVSLPETKEFSSAVQNTPGASVSDEGLLLNLTRRQVPSQSGQESVRGGVFYLPEKSSNARYYSGKPGQWYGGEMPISGQTLVKNPLFVKGATGGKAPEVAYEQVMGKGSLKELDAEVNRIIGASFVKRQDPKLFEEFVGEFLSKYGSDPSTAKYIIKNSQKGNQLKYALREGAISNAVRSSGYDSIIGFSNTKSGPTISELFDLREATYPISTGESKLRKEFASLLD